MIQEKKTLTAGPHILKFKIEDIPNIYFTSDIHANHENIIKYCNRPFKDAAEMNGVIFSNINKEIENNPNAILINCGDFIFSNNGKYDELMNSIKAKKIYNIIGNHDMKNIVQRRELVPYNENEHIFWSTELYIQIYGEKNKLLLQFTVSHYPHCDGQFFGLFNIHGHLHTPKNLDDYEGIDINIARKLRDKGLCYDVGVDGNDFKPVKLTDVLTGNLIMYQLKVVDFEKWKNLLNC